MKKYKVKGLLDSPHNLPNHLPDAKYTQPQCQQKKNYKLLRFTSLIYTMHRMDPTLRPPGITGLLVGVGAFCGQQYLLVNTSVYKTVTQ